MKLKTLMMGTAVAALLAGPALAQATTTAPENGVASERMETAPAPSVGMDAPVAPEVAEAEPLSLEEMTVGQVIGTPVVTQSAEDVGEIDYVITLPNGEIGAVIGIGGFLGLGEYTVALPVSDFSYDAENKTLVVARTEDQLRAMPEFDESGAESLDDELIMSDVIASALPSTPGSALQKSTAVEPVTGAGDTAAPSADTAATAPAVDGTEKSAQKPAVELNKSASADDESKPEGTASN